MVTWQRYLDDQHDRFLAELLAFLRIPSISALPAHSNDVREAAEWVAARLRSAGIDEVRILPTDGHPLVYAEWLHAPGKPTILIYGHFDTQPVDPLHLWSHPPFEPWLDRGRVYARGASDDKGNMLAPILAVEALLQSDGTLPVNLKFCFEGEEEIGSRNLPAFVAANRDLFACDLVLSADGTQWSEDQPSLLVGLRGICAVQIEVQGATTDLHSGFYGGAVPNAIHALVELLGSVRSVDGQILVDGFYDAVRPLTTEDRTLIGAVPFDVGSYLAQIGVSEPIGEPGYTTLERIWARPTLEINSVTGGFQGQGIKTVIPNRAQATITCRLVPDQEPAEIAARLVAHAERHAPQGVEVIARPSASGSRPYLVPRDHPGLQAAHTVLAELYNNEPYYTRLGASIPACDIFLRTLGVYTVILSFALEDEQFHAPDEFFRLRSFTRGQQAYCKILQQLGRKVAPASQAQPEPGTPGAAGLAPRPRSQDGAG